MYNNHRLFIAIPLDNTSQNKLVQFQQTHLNPSVFNIVSKDNLHLTLVFLGNNDNNAILQISQILNKIAYHFNPFTIILDKIEYGPTPNRQRLVWIKGAPNKILQDVKNKLQEELYSYPNINFQGEHKGFIPHITLARIQNFNTPSLLPSKTTIETIMPIQFVANSLILFESQLTRKGAQYTTLYQAFFNN